MREFRALGPNVFVLPVLLLSILWKGGKGTESTWLLAIVAAFVTIWSFVHERRRMRREHLRAHFRKEGEVHVEHTAEVSSVLWQTAMLFLLWSVLSYLRSQTANYGLDELLRDTSLVLIAFWWMREVAVERTNRGMFLLRILATATILACVIGIVVYIFQPVSRSVGTFFDARFHTHYWPNAWAEFLLLAWPAVAWRTQGKGLNGAMTLGLVLGSLFLTYSRGSGIVFLLQLIIIFVLVLLHRRRSGRSMGLSFAWKHLRTVVTVLVMALVFFFAANVLRSQFHPVESVARKVTFTADEGRSSVDERWYFWRDAVRLSMEKPLLGWGPYSFRFVQPRFQQDVLATSDHPHNVFLKIAVERGIPAMLLLIALFALFLWRGVRVLISSSTDDEGGGWWTVHRAVLLGVTGVLVHNLLDYNLQFVGIALPFWLLLAWSGPMTRGAAKFGHKLMRFAEVIIAFILLAVLVREGWYLGVSSLGRRAEGAGRWDEAVKRYEQSAKEWFSRDLTISHARILIEQGALEDADAILERGLRVNGEDARLWKLAGDLAFEEGRMEDAEEAHEEAYQRGRYNDAGIFYAMLKTLAARRDGAALFERKGDFDRVAEAYAYGIRQNAHFIALSGNVEQFRAAVDLMSLLYPEDAKRYQAMGEEAADIAERTRSQFAAKSPGYLW